MSSKAFNGRYIITGGPGFGKTTLLNQMILLGFQGFQEVARDLLNAGLSAPMDDPDSRSNRRFFKMIVNQRIEQYFFADSASINFFDRGLPDSLAFFRSMAIEPPASLLYSIKNHPYNKTVFIVPPWQNIYREDEVRTESFNQAVIIHQHIIDVYEELGYQLVKLPQGSLEDRIEVILSIVQ